MPLTVSEAVRIVTLLEEGYSQRIVANRVGVAQSTVSEVGRRYRETNQFTRRPGQGRRRSTSHLDDRFIVLRSLRNRTYTAPELQGALAEVRRVNISERTVRRRLAEVGLRARRPANGPRLLAHHKIQRLRFARQHVNWGREQWSTVLFTDESRFALRSPDGRQRVWRRPGERYLPCTMIPKEPFGGGSVMVWGGVNSQFKTELVVFDRNTVTADRYITEVLEPHVLPLAYGIEDNFLLIQDNARPHVANVTRQYLEEVEVACIDWPARSPDLNVIEHVWDMLGRRLRARLHRPDNLQELSAALVEEWENLPQESISNLIDSMPRRLDAVIRGRGGNTRY